MAILDRVKFDSPDDTVLVWKYPSEELRLGSQLVVNQAQEAVFAKGGQILDVFGPGTHTLSSGNLPLLHRFINLPFGGETPFTAEVWFVNRTVKRDLRWGTTSPVPLIEPEYGFPVSLRAYGRFGIQIRDSKLFVSQIVGSLAGAECAKVLQYFIGEIQQKFSSIVASFVADQKTSIFRVNTALNELSQKTRDAITPEFERFGIEVINYNVERVSIPDEELARFQQVLGKRMEIDQISKAKVGEAYITMRTFDTLEKAAENQSGGAGALLAGGIGLGAGLGAGVPLGQQLGRVLNPNAGESGRGDHIERIRALKQLLDENLISAEEFETRKKAIVDTI